MNASPLPRAWLDRRRIVAVLRGWANPIRHRVPIVVTLLLVVPDMAASNDRLIIRRAGSQGKIEIRGEILEHRGDEVTVQPDSDSPVQVFRGAEIVLLDPERSPSHQEGRRLLSIDPAQASIRLEQALNEEKRAWRRRDILADLIRSAVAQQDYAVAGSRYLALENSDPETGHIAVMPLRWTRANPSREDRAAAIPWLRSNSPTAQLLGASQLLMDSALAAESQAVLRQISRGDSLRLQPLAQWQLRRPEAFSGQPRLTDLQYWQVALDRLPADLQGGPAFLVAEALDRRSESILAASYWLRLITLEVHDLRLSADAMSRAITTLRRLGQSAEADRLEVELRQRFPASPPDDSPDVPAAGASSGPNG
jgi:hypothetical protein